MPITGFLGIIIVNKYYQIKAVIGISCGISVRIRFGFQVAAIGAGGDIAQSIRLLGGQAPAMKRITHHFDTKGADAKASAPFIRNTYCIVLSLMIALFSAAVSAQDIIFLKHVKEQRKGRYIGKAVLPDTSADHEGIINFTASNIKVGAATYETGGKYASRIAGILAGTPADCSATYAPLPEVTGVDAIEDADAAINSGKLILINDGRQVKLGRAVTSKTTVADGETQALKKIKMVAAVDLIRYYALTTIEDNYQGKCSNTYDNKCILLTALRGYLKELENGDVLLEKSSGAELDAAATRAFLIDQASKAGDVEEANRIKALDDAAVIKEDTGSYVFIRLYGYVLDAMEDFALVLEVSNGLLAV